MFDLLATATSINRTTTVIVSERRSCGMFRSWENIA